jgi:hypothetical protein
MKSDRRIERLYAELNPKETVVLVFSHLSQWNVAEADRIRDLVPMKRYLVPDPHHTDHFERLRRVTLYYGMERWRYEAHCRSAVAVILHCCHSHDAEDEERVQVCFEVWQMWETRLLSLDAAVEGVCRKHNVDVTDLRHMADIEGPYRALGVDEVDRLLVTEMTKAFDKVLQPD